MWRFGSQALESVILACVLQGLWMAIFNAGVHGMRAEAGKVIYDVDVNGQKSSPFTYRQFPRPEDLWALNIHTTGEERDCVMAAINEYHARNPIEKDATFAIARAQDIPLQTGTACLRCAKAAITVDGAKRTKCSECGASYVFAP